MSNFRCVIGSWHLRKGCHLCKAWHLCLTFLQLHGQEIYYTLRGTMPAHVVHNTTFQYIYIFIWGEYNEYYLVDFKAQCAIWNDMLWHDIWHVFFLFIFHRWFHYRADSMFAPSQWETALLCNDVSHWLGANIESALPYILNWYLRQRHGFDIIATTLRFVILPLIAPYVACNVYLCHASNHVISLIFQVSYKAIQQQ